MIWWKHPEHAVFVAEYLRSKSIPFEMTIVGDGEKSIEIDTLISEKNLSSYITRKSFVKPDNKLYVITYLALFKSIILQFVSYLFCVPLSSLFFVFFWNN